MSRGWREYSWLAIVLVPLCAIAQQPDDRDHRARLPTQQELDKREALKLYTKALLQKSEHRYLEAVRTLEEARRLDPEAAAIHKTLGSLHQLLDHTDDALASYKRTTELDPSDGETWFRYAQLLRRENKMKEATDALSRGVKAQSLAELPEVRYAMFVELGDIYEELKDPAKAVEAFEPAWKILEKP